jgi:hypothetical protein
MVRKINGIAATLTGKEWLAVFIVGPDSSASGQVLQDIELVRISELEQKLREVLSA